MQQTHAKIASARIYLNLAGVEEDIGLRAIWAKEQSVLPGVTFHLDISATAGGEPTKLECNGMVGCIYTIEVGAFLHFPIRSTSPTPNSNVSQMD